MTKKISHDKRKRKEPRKNGSGNTQGREQVIKARIWDRMKTGKETNSFFLPCLPLGNITKMGNRNEMLAMS